MPRILTGHIIVATCLTLLILCKGMFSYAQTPINQSELKNNYNDTISQDSSLAILSRYMSTHFVVIKHVINKKTGEETLYVKAGWKSYRIIHVTEPFHHTTDAVSFSKNIATPFLKVHGNVLYDIDYRSNIDTPFAEKDIYQHTIQTYLDITVRDRYPIRVYLTNHFSNSSLFRNFSTVNFQFDQLQFNQNIRERLKAKLEHNFAMGDSSALLHSLLVQRNMELAGLKSWLNDPATLQKLVEAREHALLEGKRKELQDQIAQKELNSAPLKGKRVDTLAGQPYHKFEGGGLSAKLDSLVNVSLRQPKDTAHDSKLTRLDSAFAAKLSNSKGIDSLKKDKLARLDSTKARAESFVEAYERKRRLVDSLEGVVGKLEQRYQKLNQGGALDLARQRSDIDHLSNARELEEKCKEMHVEDSTLPKGYRKLSALRSFGIGSSVLDYSELTARGIAINGIEAEYNPSYYVAVASGYIDYRARDFFISRNAPKQYLTILRYGRGMKDGNNIIFSYYFGKRQLFNSSTAIQGTTVPSYDLVGYSLEGHYRIDKSNELVAEFAKSSFPYYSGQVAGKGSLIAGAVRYGERSNEAYSLKYLTHFKKTDTRLTASFSSLGNNFQSFSVFTTGTSRTNWAFKLEQPLWKQRINITAAVRTNDFIYPNISGTLRNSTVFKSLQATLKVRRWPIVTLGYYPSSQVTKVSGTQYSESLFYTLTATLTHFYQYKGLNMNSALVCSRFYNRPQDSGFVYFNTRNLLLSQNIFFDRWSYLASLSICANTDYTLYTLENSCQYRLLSWLSVGAGLKYNRQSITHTTLLGYSANATVTIKKLGEFQLMADNGYIPGNNRRLVPNNIGRVSYFRSF